MSETRHVELCTKRCSTRDTRSYVVLRFPATGAEFLVSEVMIEKRCAHGLLLLVRVAGAPRDSLADLIDPAVHYTCTIKEKIVRGIEADLRPPGECVDCTERQPIAIDAVQLRGLFCIAK